MIMIMLFVVIKRMKVIVVKNDNNKVSGYADNDNYNFNKSDDND